MQRDEFVLQTALCVSIDGTRLQKNLNNAFTSRQGIVQTKACEQLSCTNHWYTGKFTDPKGLSHTRPYLKSTAKCRVAR